MKEDRLHQTLKQEILTTQKLNYWHLYRYKIGRGDDESLASALQVFLADHKSLAPEGHVPILASKPKTNPEESWRKQMISLGLGAEAIA